MVQTQLTINELFPLAVTDSLVPLADVDVQFDLVLDAEADLVDLE